MYVCMYKGSGRVMITALVIIFEGNMFDPQWAR